MIITADILKEILDKVPGDFEVEFFRDDISYPICDRIEVDVSGRRVILKP